MHFSCVLLDMLLKVSLDMTYVLLICVARHALCIFQVFSLICSMYLLIYVLLDILREHLLSYIVQYAFMYLLYVLLNMLYMHVIVCMGC